MYVQKFGQIWGPLHFSAQARGLGLSLLCVRVFVLFLLGELWTPLVPRVPRESPGSSPSGPNSSQSSFQSFPQSFPSQLNLYSLIIYTPAPPPLIFKISLSAANICAQARGLRAFGPPEVPLLKGAVFCAPPSFCAQAWGLRSTKPKTHTHAHQLLKVTGIVPSLTFVRRRGA